MKFLVDTQLPPRLAEWLTDRRYPSQHTTAFPKGSLLQDKEIREIAIDQNLIIITKDSDFEDYYFVKGAPPRILLLAIGNSSNTELIKLIDRNLDQIIERFKEEFNLVLLTKKEVIGFK